MVLFLKHHVVLKGLTVYITEQLLNDRLRFGLKITENNFAYFLRMVKITYERTKNSYGYISKCIFVVQCNLYNKYYRGIHINKNLKLQIALKNKDFKQYFKEMNKV